MGKEYIVEKEFDHAGYKCVVVFQIMGHRCGYVGIPETHPLYKKGYDSYLDIKKEDIEGREVSNVIELLMGSLDSEESVRAALYFQCHGGLTYSGGGEGYAYPIESNLWWFGFDCAHWEDGKDLQYALKCFPEFSSSIERTIEIEEKFGVCGEVRTLDYVTDECMKLADQLKGFENET